MADSQGFAGDGDDDVQPGKRRRKVLRRSRVFAWRPLVPSDSDCEKGVHFSTLHEGRSRRVQIARRDGLEVHVVTFMVSR